MVSLLEYPFDSGQILRKKKSLRRELLESSVTRIQKRIAVLGGSSTQDIVAVLELFLLHYGIEPHFYESSYGKYWEDAMFANEDLELFDPDIVFIHTSYRNIGVFPSMSDSRVDVEGLIEDEFARYTAMWENIQQKYDCVIIQNNFDLPPYRLLGNRDAFDHRGQVNYVRRINNLFADYAARTDNFFINDLEWLSSQYGLEKWQDAFYWHMYKYALAVPAIPEFAFNVANIIKSIYGKNKKALVLDLDNTLWGGVVGDDGLEGIDIGQETPQAQMYSEFQAYVKAQKDIGVLLAIDSKNEEENARAGLSRPDSVLHPEDFILIKANWEPKDINLRNIAAELNLGEDALVFVDDNPAERAIVQGNVAASAVPPIEQPHAYIRMLDRSGFFEATTFSADDLNRVEMYRANAQRTQAQASFTDYNAYLASLEMKAEIAPFAPLYMDRIAQLTNKTNQFNLTTKRCSLADIQSVADDPRYITLYGKLEDKFGDNGVVAVLFGRLEGNSFDIELWLMSCRVFKRDMECAMMDRLVSEVLGHGATRIVGHYCPTAKNKMVKDFYAQFGFVCTSEDEHGNATWVLEDATTYLPHNNVISLVCPSNQEQHHEQ